jgi:hypothetical protein
VGRHLVPSLILAALLGIPARAQQPPARPATDLDAFMAQALRRRDIDRKTLSDYVLDEVEAFEVLGPGKVPVVRMRREYTWYVRDGYHVRSPLKFDGVPIPESERRKYEERWMHSEMNRRQYREKRAEKRAAEGKPPAMSVPSVNEPRFISESYFLDFKFEPGNYYLAGREPVDGKDALVVDYLPARMFDDEDRSRQRVDEEEDIDRKMDKTSQVTLWVDPVSHQIVKYTFDNVWLDFLPAGWLVRIDDLRANMQMGQPFPGVWLPKEVRIHAGLTFALGPLELQYTRAFSNYRKADVTSKITVPKKVAR